MMPELPLCYFDSLSCLACATNQCEIWLVVAKNTSESMDALRFESEKTSSDILIKSPYSDAFRTQVSPNYFLTKVGAQSSLPCGGMSSGASYFRVGAQVVCEETNCYRVLPIGSTVRVKYVLVDSSSKTIRSETSWCPTCNSYNTYVLTFFRHCKRNLQNYRTFLYFDHVYVCFSVCAVKSWSSIDEFIGKRSGGMVVITVISSCLLAVLLLLLGAVLLLDGSITFPGAGSTIQHPKVFEEMALLFYVVLCLSVD
ncbi:unnamed protein product [Coregonus sp. 'balchen']|nr:unnamed protein product [Coregonus sp. 'balchen']